MKSKFGPFLIVIAAFLWGFDGVIRRSLFSLPSLTIVFFEHLIGLLLILPFFIPFLTSHRLSLGRKEWIAIVWVSFFSGLMGTFWFTSALSQTKFIPFSVVFLLQKLQPLFAIITANLILHEQLSKKYLKWGLLALFSAYFVTFPKGVVNFDTGSQTIVAALMSVAAAFAWGSSTAISRYVLIHQSNTTTTSLRFLFTTGFSLVAILIFRSSFPVLTLPNQSQFFSLSLIAFSTGLFALWIYYQGLKYTQAKISTLLELTFPLTAVFIDIFLYHSQLQLTQYLASSVLIFAIYRLSFLNHHEIHHSNSHRSRSR